MAFTEYLPDNARILKRLDEKVVAKLTRRVSSGETWEKTVLQENKQSAYNIFEAHAVNVYSLDDLRTDPPAEFAVELIIDILIYNLYQTAVRHAVPREVRFKYKEAMKVLRGWGEPKIINAVIAEDSVSSASVLYNKTEDDLEFTYEDQEGMW